MCLHFICLLKLNINSSQIYRFIMEYHFITSVFRIDVEYTWISWQGKIVVNLAYWHGMYWSVRSSSRRWVKGGVDGIYHYFSQLQASFFHSTWKSGASSKKYYIDFKCFKSLGLLTNFETLLLSSLTTFININISISDFLPCRKWLERILAT